MNTSTHVTRVWDPIVRIGHWALVIAFFTAYFTEDEWMTQHVWAGYIVGGIVVFRILWGLIGSKYARFSDFIYSPSAIFAYLKSLFTQHPKHYLGHNPAGGAMVIALLLSLGATVYSGLALYAVEENAGPLASVYGFKQVLKPSLSLISLVQAEESEANENEANETEKTPFSVNEQDEEYWEDLHEFFANLTLLLVALHVTGVILASRLHKENLVKAMITGNKETPHS
jgi:cytochrome b